MGNSSIQVYLANDEVKSRINNMLKERASQFIASIAAAVSSDAKLAECEPGTILTAALTAAAMNLPVNNNLGFVYLIPYKNNKTGETKATLQFGYKSYIQLAQRSGQFKTINVTDVKEGEIISENNLSGEIEFEWIKEGREKAKTVGYVAYMKLINGFEKILYMTNEQLKAHGVKFSKSLKAGYGLWKDEFDVMAKKTVIKLLLSKYAPMTVDMQTAALADQSIVKDDGYEYIDNQPADHEEISAEKEKQRVIKHIEVADTFEKLVECAEAVTDETRSLYEAKADEIRKAKDAK